VPRKPRPPREPWTEGCVAELYRLFVQPLLKYKPATDTIKEWQEKLFHTEHRSVTQYLVCKPFKMPGLLRVAANKPVQGVGYRGVSIGDTIYVRTDAEYPDVIDVEILAGQGRKEHVYLLSLSELNSIMACLIATDDSDKEF